jgi:error-prone DNA polymerase
MTAYAELVSASNFSFLRGASHPEELIAAAQVQNLAAIALTDRNSLAGAVRAHQVAKVNNVRFIAGARLVLQDGIEIACLPTSRAAYGRLCQLLTAGNLRAAKAECHLALDDVLKFGEGQIFIGLPGAEESSNEFAGSLKTLVKRFPHSTYLGAALLFDGEDQRRLAKLALLSQETRSSLVAIGDCLYHDPSRKALQDVLTCVREKCTIAEAGYRLQANAERHVKGSAEMLRLYRGYEDAVARTLEIANRCRFSLDELRYDYPDEPYEPFASPQEALTAHVWKGAAERYPEGMPDKITAQIAHELELIEKLDYARYFLTVFDLVRYAKEKKILCQGRGSAANSAVCYCLGVTAVNPVEIDLLFERFISAERREPPDIDVDFEHERREEVMRYVYDKYGRDRAGIVATVITYRAKSAIRDVGKAMGLSEDIITALSGTIWGWSSQGVAPEHLKEAGLDPADRTLRLAIHLAQTLIGFPRHLSQHTGGFVITKGPLDTIIPIGNAAMKGRTMIEWNKDDLDALGLLKIDVLALGMLTCIRKSFDLLKQHYGVTEKLATIQQGDEKTYDMICEADTLGVFQIESRAQMSMLPRLRPRNFYDLVIEVAIVRPGPIQGDMVHPYLQRRQNPELVNYPSEQLREVLGKTLGVPLFQEQAMKIAIVAAGFSPEEADRLRRAMATFRHTGTIHAFGTKLIKGMIANGYDRDFAERCFRQIEGFGEYGFPESHAASFALLVYVSCWLKCHYPDVFGCALLNSQPMGFYAPAQIVRDFREHGGEARPADINHSDWDCTLEEGKKQEDGKPYRALRLGFRQVKGIVQKDVEAIMAARAGFPFRSLEDFASRTGLGMPALKLLAEADAFRSIGLDRRQALWAVARYRETGTPAALSQELPMFAGASAIPAEPHVPLPGMPLGEHVLTDYATVRMSLKAHPMALLRRTFADFGYVKTKELATLPVNTVVKVAGIVLIRQRPGSAKGVIFSTLEDETGIANIITWPKIFERYRRTVIAARLLGVRGTLQREQGVIHVVARELFDMSAYLRDLSEKHGGGDAFLSPADHVKHGGEDPRGKPRRGKKSSAEVLPKGRNFH